MDGNRANKGRQPLAERSEQTMKARSARFSPEQTVNDTSSAMTIDNDSNASTRTHIMGVPGARIPSVQLRHIQQQNPVRTRPRAFSTDSPISPTTESPLSFGQQPRRGLAAMHTANARIGTSRAADSQGKARQRRISSSPLGITRDNTLHQQLLLVGAPNPTDATNIVTRLPVEEEENRMPGAYTTAIGSAKVQSPPIEKESSAATAKANKASTSKPKAATRSHSQQHPAASTQTAEPSTARLAQPPHVFTFKAQPSTQEQQHQHNGKIDISNRPIALPKTRLSNLRPTLRQMPKSKEVAQIDAQFSSNGSPVARRPDYFVFEDGPLDEDDHGIELSSSYIDDIGFDLADAELNSDFGKSFDLDMLPDPPPRRLSDYNIGVKEVPIRSPPPEATKGDDDLVKEKSVSENKKKKHSIARQANGAGAPNELQQQQQPLSATSQCTSATSIQSSAYESATDDVSTRFTATPRPTGLAAMVVQEEPETHRTLGLPRNNQLFSKPAITEDNAHFYIKMFALRSTVPAEELSSPESPEQRTGYSSRSITTIENLPAEPVQPQQQERLSDLRPSPHRSNFWPVNISMFQRTTQQPLSRESENIYPCVEVQAECPRVLHTPASFVSKARDFFRGRPKSKSTTGYNASGGRHIAQQPSTKAPTTTTAISTAAEQQCCQTMPSPGATLPHTGAPGLRKRATTMGYAYGLEARRQTGSATAAGADSNTEHMVRRHTVHISAGSGSAPRQNTSCRAVQSDNYSPRDCRRMAAQYPLQAENFVRAGRGSGRSSEVEPKQLPLSEEEYATAANDVEKLPDARLSSSLGDNGCDCCGLRRGHCRCCCGSCFPGCWPFKMHRSGKHKALKKATATIDPIKPEEQLPTNPPASPSNSVFSSLSESWSHVYRSRNAGRPVTRKREKIRDTCSYPFRLSYNCFLLCSTPCIGLAREYRTACTCC